MVEGVNLDSVIVPEAEGVGQGCPMVAIEDEIFPEGGSEIGAMRL
jgi:hypothetical protein